MKLISLTTFSIALTASFLNGEKKPVLDVTTRTSTAGESTLKLGKTIGAVLASTIVILGLKHYSRKHPSVLQTSIGNIDIYHWNQNTYKKISSLQIDTEVVVDPDKTKHCSRLGPLTSLFKTQLAQLSQPKPSNYVQFKEYLNQMFTMSTNSKEEAES